MPSIPEGPHTPTPAPHEPWRFLAVSALVALLAATFALAAPRAEPPAAAAVTPATCSGLALPPGHPPIAGQAAPAPAIQLPPGHPPIDRRSLGALRSAPPLDLSFEPPATVDI